LKCQRKKLAETILSETSVSKESSNTQVNDSLSNNVKVKMLQSKANVSAAKELPDANNATSDVATESYPTQTQSCVVHMKSAVSNAALQD
jgi:hypothetical protein